MDFNDEMAKDVMNTTIDDLIAEIKQMPMFAMYQQTVKSLGAKYTYQFLEAAVMLAATNDKKLSLKITRVAMDLLFAMIDQKLQSEILGGEANGEGD